MNTVHSTTPGKYRHLTRAATPGGHFVVLAIDHRRNLWDALQAHSDAPVTPALFAAFKRHAIAALAGEASAVLTDPAYGLPNGGLTVRGGLLCPLEVTDYSVHPSQRGFRPIPDWGVEQIKRAGGDGVKLLLYYHPDAPNAADQRAVVEWTVDECARWDIPLYLEPIAFSPDPDRPLSAIEHQQVVIESARTFSTLGIDVLKAEFPVDIRQVTDETMWMDALQALDAACSVPWTLLSAGVSYGVFKRQVELACRAGASGIIAGRAVWNEAVELHGEARESFLRLTAVQRLRELAAIVAQYARPWTARISAPELSAQWFHRSEIAGD